MTKDRKRKVIKQTILKSEKHRMQININNNLSRDTCWTGLNSTLKNKIKIGNKVIVGTGALVIDDVIDEDIVAGVPAKSIKQKVTSDKLFLMAGQKRPSPEL